jgi:hypothetical protein
MGFTLLQCEFRLVDRDFFATVVISKKRVENPNQKAKAINQPAYIRLLPGAVIRVYLYSH